MGASWITFAYFLLGLGPGLAFYVIFILPKSFLVLLTFTSTFYWLLVLLVTSAIFRGFLPVAQTQAAYAGVLIGSVAIQEAARLLLWRVHSKTDQVLQVHARSSGHRYHLIDKLYLAVGWGWGHGAAHVVFFYLSFLPLTTGDGTWYLDSCPDFSIFLGGALYSLAFGMLLPSLMIIAWEGLHEQHWLHMLWPPLAHLGASLLTLLNFERHGCRIVFPVLLGVGGLHVAYAAQLIWRKGSREGVASSPTSASATPLVQAGGNPFAAADPHGFQPQDAEDDGSGQSQYNNSTGPGTRRRPGRG